MQVCLMVLTSMLWLVMVIINVCLTVLCMVTDTLTIRVFHRITICQRHNHMGKNYFPPINRRSTVVKAVKLMAWVKSPLKITT